MGSSRSSQQVENRTTVNTTTTTSVGDIGLTGDDAVALARTIADNNIASAQIQEQAFSGLLDQFGQLNDSFQNTVRSQAGIVVGLSEQAAESGGGVSEGTFRNQTLVLSAAGVLIALITLGSRK